MKRKARRMICPIGILTPSKCELCTHSETEKIKGENVLVCRVADCHIRKNILERRRKGKK